MHSRIIISIAANTSASRLSCLSRDGWTYPRLGFGKTIQPPSSPIPSFAASASSVLTSLVLTSAVLAPLLDDEKLQRIRKYFSQAVSDEFSDSQTHIYGYEEHCTGYDPADKKYHGTKVTEDPEVKKPTPQDENDSR